MSYVPWDRLAIGIRRRLPEWARYRGKATVAVSAFVYAAAATAVAGYAALSGLRVIAAVLGAFALVLLLVGNYYRVAAMRRVECNHCGRKARGWDECPHCGEYTFVGEQ